MYSKYKNNETKRKPAQPTPKCLEMLKKATEYIAKNSPTQAKIMNDKFFSIAKILEILPELGRKYNKDLRIIKLGKFRYDIYYREEKDKITIVGIWHTSRGTRFYEP